MSKYQAIMPLLTPGTEEEWKAMLRVGWPEATDIGVSTAAVPRGWGEDGEIFGWARLTYATEDAYRREHPTLQGEEPA